jgi:hypothetical protein
MLQILPSPFSAIDLFVTHTRLTALYLDTNGSVLLVLLQKRKKKKKEEEEGRRRRKKPTALKPNMTNLRLMSFVWYSGGLLS